LNKNIEFIIIIFKMSNVEVKNYNPGRLFLLFLVFLVLKLTKVITWSWWWVTCPLWAPLIFIVILLIIYLFLDFK
jgi:hypothetical protein